MGKSKNKLIVVIAVLVILIIGVGAAILYLATDIFKGNQEMFYKYLSKNMENMEQLISIDDKQNFEVLKQNTHTTNTKVNFELVSNDQEIANQAIPARNFSVEIKSQEDPQNNKKYSESTLKFLTRDLFTLKYIQDGDQYAIKSDEVVNKYLSFQNNNLKDLATKFGITNTSNIPNKIGELKIADLFTLTEEEKTTIAQKYMPILTSNISEDKYTKQLKTTVQVNDQNVVTNMYGLQMTNQELNNLIVVLLQNLQQDDYTLNILLRKYQLINSEATLQDVTNWIQTKISQLNSQNLNGTFKISIYEKDNKIIKVAISNSELFELSIEYRTTENAINAIINLDYYYEVENQPVEQAPVVDDGYQIIQDENHVEQENVQQEQSTKTMGLGELLSTIKTIEIAKQKDENGIQTIIIGNIESGENKIKLSMQDNLQQDDSQTANRNVIVKINVDDVTYFTVDLTTNYTQTNNINIEGLTGENAAIVNNFTPSYISTLLVQIPNRLIELYNQKIEIVKTVQEEENNTNNNQNTTVIQENSNEQSNADNANNI